MCWWSAGPGEAAQLPARRDPELDEDFPQVPLGSVCADEQLRADRLVRQPVGGQLCDLSFLGGELVARAQRLLADLFAGGGEFSAGSLSETLRTHGGEHLVGGGELRSRIDPAVLPAEPFTVGQPGARQL